MKKLIQLGLVLLGCLILYTGANGQAKPHYTFEKTISLPGDGGYDYLAIDSINNRLYVSHGDQVNVLDLTTEQPVGAISGMTGVHGIALVNEINKGFISDGKLNAVIVFDLGTLNKIKTIPISGDDPDAIIYDPFSKHVFVFNGHSKNASVIDIAGLKEISSISLSGAPEFAVTDGNGIIYNNDEDNSQLNIIDSKSFQVLEKVALSPCGGPTGLALDPAHSRLFTVCRENKGMSVVSINTKKVMTTIPIGSGVDAVVYDPVTSILVCSNGDGTATVIQQNSPDNYAVIQTLSTTQRAKTVALNRKTHKIYFSAPQFEQGTKNRVAGSFKLYVYKLDN